MSYCSQQRKTRVHVLGHLALACLVIGLVGCDDKKGNDKKDPNDHKAVAVKMRTVEVTPEKIAQGKASFGACMGCHGEKAEGKVGIGPRLASKSFLAAASDTFLLNTIKNGRTGTTMIPWGTTFKDEQIESIIAYLRSLEPVGPATLDNKPLDGDLAKGKQVFDTICYTCHGRNGGGYQETANGTGIGRKVFLDVASNGFLRYIINEGKTHTAMHGFSRHAPAAVANLDATQIDGLIAYLRKNAW